MSEVVMDYKSGHVPTALEVSLGVAKQGLFVFVKMRPPS